MSFPVVRFVFGGQEAAGAGSGRPYTVVWDGTCKTCAKLVRLLERGGQIRVFEGVRRVEVAAVEHAICRRRELPRRRIEVAGAGQRHACQHLLRGRVVGEKTAGAANPGRGFDLGHGFAAFIPDVPLASSGLRGLFIQTSQPWTRKCATCRS